MDPRVLAFAAAVSLISGLLFGVSPALRAARLDPSKTLAGQGRGSVSAGGDVLRFRQWLVTAQVALTLVLLVAAGLFVGSLRNLGRVQLGLKPDHVISFSIAPKLNGYSSERTATVVAGADRAAPGSSRSLVGHGRGAAHPRQHHVGLERHGRGRRPGGQRGPRAAQRRRARRTSPPSESLCLRDATFAWSDDAGGPARRHHQRGVRAEILRKREPRGRPVRLRRRPRRQAADVDRRRRRRQQVGRGHREGRSVRLHSLHPEPEARQPDVPRPFVAGSRHAGRGPARRAQAPSIHRCRSTT